MKILELNTQKENENSYKSNLKQIIKTIIDEQPDVFSLQGVSQSSTSPRVIMTDNLGYVPNKWEHIRIRLDNSALSIAEMLRKERLPYKWTWRSFDSKQRGLEQGMAVFVKNANHNLEQFSLEDKIKCIKEIEYE